MSLLGEVKRRKVFRVAAVYAVVAWLVVQIVGELNDPLSLPPWFDTVVIVLLAAGFPMALVLAWAFDLTPEGVVRTPAASLGSEAAKETATSEASTPPIPPTPPVASAGARPETLRNSVAVLPLENLSPNPDDAYFAAGIHEEILNQLAKIKDLSVIARTSVKRYQDTRESIAKIAAELGVGTVVEGSVRYAGQRVRVTAQLIDAKTEKHLWSEVYERDLADVFAIQADVATKIAEALEAKLSMAERDSVEKLPTASAEAYALYLRVLAIFQDHGHHVGGMSGLSSTARSYLDQAIALDPDFALAYVARARLCASRLNQDPGIYENSAARREELESLALADLRRALELDAGIGAAHAILARIHQFNWRGAEARGSYRRAVELSPNDPEVLMDFAVFCAITGDFDEARDLASQSIRLDPNSAQGHMWLSIIRQHRGDLDAAREAIRRSTVLLPTFGPAHLMLAMLESVTGDPEEALKHARLGEQLSRDHTNPAFTAQFAIVYARLGRREDAGRICRALEEMAKTHVVPSTAWIAAYVAIGDEERALHWLDEAAERPESYVGHFGLMLIKANAFGDTILAKPRFQAARARLGFRD